MSNFIAFALLAVLIAIPTVAVVRAYRHELEPVRDALRRLLALDAKHPGLADDATKNRTARV